MAQCCVPMSAWVHSVCCGFLQRTKNMQKGVRLSRTLQKCEYECEVEVKVLFPSGRKTWIPVQHHHPNCAAGRGLPAELAHLWRRWITEQHEKLDRDEPRTISTGFFQHYSSQLKPTAAPPVISPSLPDVCKL